MAKIIQSCIVCCHIFVGTIFVGRCLFTGFFPAKILTSYKRSSLKRPMRQRKREKTRPHAVMMEEPRPASHSPTALPRRRPCFRRRRRRHRRRILFAPASSAAACAASSPPSPPSSPLQPRSPPPPHTPSQPRPPYRSRSKNPLSSLRSVRRRHIRSRRHPFIFKIIKTSHRLLHRLSKG